MSDTLYTAKKPISALKTDKLICDDDSRDYYNQDLSKTVKQNYILHEMDSKKDHTNCSNSDLCLTEAQCTDEGLKVNYSTKERFSERENIETNIEDIDYSEINKLRTLPPKYSDKNDVRNNVICANNNIYIYTENKNGALNEQARITVSDNNVISCATIGRRYTIGGYKNIQKKINNEYTFFNELNGLDATERMNTFEFDTIDNEDVLLFLNKVNLLKNDELALKHDVSRLNSSHLFSEQTNSPDTMRYEDAFTNRTLSADVSVQKLFQDHKRYAQNVEHDQRICKPCAHVYNGSTCMNGDDCAFCHHHDHELISAKKWKKLVKNNVAKLNLLLKVMKDPNEANVSLLNEVMKSNNVTNAKNGTKKNKKFMSTNSSMGMNMNMTNTTYMPMYNNNTNSTHKPFKYNYHAKQHNVERMPRNGGYGFYQGNDSPDNNRTRHFVGNYRMGMSRNYNNVMPTPHVHI